MDNSNLIELGFAPFFQQQISLEERERCAIARVTEVRRSGLIVTDGRLERYLSLALEAGVTPVIVITKADLTETADEYRERVQRIAPATPVELVNALDADTLGSLLGWVTAGQTVAFVGSSGVGKSTLINSLLGHSAARTGAIREDDSRGRHTTSYRALFQLPKGGLLIDVPGMRELKVTEVETVLDDVFADIAEAAERCRFKDCSHASEPSCAVRAAVEAGEIDARRLRSFLRLQREDARHNASLAERRDQDRKLGKLYKSILDQCPRRRSR